MSEYFKIKSKSKTDCMRVIAEPQGLLLIGTSAERDVFISGAICMSKDWMI